MCVKCEVDQSGQSEVDCCTLRAIFGPQVFLILNSRSLSETLLQLSCLDQVLSLLILILLACLSRDFGSLSASPVPSRPLIGCCWPPVQEPPNFTLLCQLHNCGSHLHCSTGFQLEQSKKEADRLYPIITMSSSRRPHSPFFVPTFLSFDHRSTI